VPLYRNILFHANFWSTCTFIIEEGSTWIFLLWKGWKLSPFANLMCNSFLKCYKRHLNYSCLPHQCKRLLLHIYVLPAQFNFYSQHAVRLICDNLYQCMSICKKLSMTSCVMQKTKTRTKTINKSPKFLRWSTSFWIILSSLISYSTRLLYAIFP
jgi:hypothetical protein